MLDTFQTEHLSNTPSTHVQYPSTLSQLKKLV